MLINYFSDIHLEFGPLEIPATEAQVIIAAGDIGIYKQGAEWLKRAQKPVIYVAGNHEFYDQEYHATIAAIRDVARGSQVHFLERDQVVIDQVRFLGCTLWTNLGGAESDASSTLARKVNDFRKIRYGKAALIPRIYKELNQESLEWLLEALSQPFDGETVVVTHHAPSFWSWKDSPSSPVRYSYCNDLRWVMHEHPIAAWFHGHTHALSDYRCAGARILCNPRGYWGYHTVAGFLPSRTVEI